MDVMKINKINLKKVITFILILALSLTFIFCMYKIILWINDGVKTNKIKEELIKNVDEKPSIEENTEIINPPNDKKNDYWDYIKMNMLDVNFSELKKKNKDTIGWIKLEGTNVNYPVVQGTDNSYYLNHSFDKSYNKAGWVFMDYRNDYETLNKNTIIYAHARVDGTMFGTLKKVLNEEWHENKSNHIIKFSTITKNYLWQIFSVYETKKESYYLTTKFSSDNDFNNFINVLKERSIFNFSATPKINDKIITLSTCKDSKGNRIVVHAILIKMETK